MTAHLVQLAALAASLPPGAVLAHVVTGELWEELAAAHSLLSDVEAMDIGTFNRLDRSLSGRPRAWAKIGDEPWRSVSRVELNRYVPLGPLPPVSASPPMRWAGLQLAWPAGPVDGFGFPMWGTVTATFCVVTDSVTWEQGYGLRGRHEVMGVAEC